MSEKKQSGNIDLSIIITAHSEGLIAHKTMLSLFDATTKLDTDNISYEFIISIDNGTADTIAYFDRYQSTPKFKVLYVSFKDLSTSRNNAAHEANGRYITFLDADDLVSDNWLLEGFKLASKNEMTIVHPEYSITFGDDNLVWQKRNSANIAHDTLCLIDNNLWDSPCLADKSIFHEYPYHPNGSGFGYEDKHFNSQTLAAGIHHLVAPETILFVRRKMTGSMLRQASSDLVTVAKNKLLSFDAIRQLDISHYQEDSHQPVGLRQKALTHSARYTKKAVMAVHHQLTGIDIYANTIKPLRERRQASIQKGLSEKYPPWMIEAWKKIHKIDNSIFPSKDLLKRLPWYNAENQLPGYRYTKVVQAFSRQPDSLIFVPHLIKGGADLVFINYALELQRTHPEWHLAMLQTEAKESVWRHKIPSTIDFVDLYQHFQGLDTETQYRLLATLVTQSGIKRIIIANSQLAYDFISRYQTLITTLNIAVYCYAFGEEFDEEGRLWGHIHTGIPRIYPVIYRILTDNQNTVNKLEYEYGFDRNKFRVHYQPTAVELRPPVAREHQPLRVLWASRVCKQKRPDILKKVSNLLDPNEFTVDAYGQLEEGLTADYFNDSQVNYRGAFNGVDALPTQEYDVFLYTSEGDGVPNILQEMTASGLPIVASNVGGIREFVMSGKTGFLIQDHEKIEDYAAAIIRLKDIDLRTKLNTGAQKLLTSRFSRDTWQESVKNDIDR